MRRVKRIMNTLNQNQSSVFKQRVGEPSSAEFGLARPNPGRKELSEIGAENDVLKEVSFNADLAQRLLTKPKYVTMLRTYVTRYRKEIAALAGKGPMEKMVSARKKRTYDRLKSKGVCSDDICVLLASLIKKQNLLAQASCYMNSEGNVDIPVEDWHDAFDLIVARYEPQVIGDPKCTNYASIIAAHEEELYALIIASYNARVRALGSAKGSRDTGEEERAMKKELAALREENGELAAKNKVLQARLDGATETNAQLREALSQAGSISQKEALAVEAEHRQEIKELSKRLEEAEAEKKALLEDLLDAVSTDETEADEDASDAFSSVDLPERGVLFLGGHPNLIKKLKRIYPDWTYLGLKDIAQMRVDRSVDLCYIWSKHLSHTATKMVVRNIREAFPTVYLEATNLKRLESEMREGYASVIGNADIGVVD